MTTRPGKGEGWKLMTMNEDLYSIFLYAKAFQTRQYLRSLNMPQENESNVNNALTLANVAEVLKSKSSGLDYFSIYNELESFNS